jgi:CDP-diacylglycerol--glycerol-3-phosphate 3-phosphatidyltransferase
VIEGARQWSERHDGQPVGGLVARWLGLTAPIARRLRWAPPLVITAGGLVLAAGAPLICLAGGRWPIAAAFAVGLSGVADTLDGAVASLTGRGSRLGAVLDSLADRVADTAYFLALWVLGAPGWVVGLAAGLAALQEYLRDRAAGLGLRRLAITVSERPTRVLLAFFLLIGAGVLPGSADVIATAGAAAGAALGAVGLAQLTRAVRRPGWDHRHVVTKGDTSAV